VIKEFEKKEKEGGMAGGKKTPSRLYFLL